MQQAVVCPDLFLVFFLGFQSRQCFLGRDSDAKLLLQIGVTTAFLLWFLLQHCLVLSSSRSRPKKSVAIEFCSHLACFLVTTSFLMLQPRFLCWGMFCMLQPDRRKTRCIKYTPICASARVAPSSIVYSWYRYRSTGTGVLTTKVLLFR